MQICRHSYPPQIPVLDWILLVDGLTGDRYFSFPELAVRSQTLCVLPVTIPANEILANLVLVLALPAVPDGIAHELPAASGTMRTLALAVHIDLQAGLAAVHIVMLRFTVQTQRQFTFAHRKTLSEIDIFRIPSDIEHRTRALEHSINASGQRNSSGSGPFLLVDDSVYHRSSLQPGNEKLRIVDVNFALLFLLGQFAPCIGKLRPDRISILLLILEIRLQFLDFSLEIILRATMDRRQCSKKQSIDS